MAKSKKTGISKKSSSRDTIPTAYAKRGSPVWAFNRFKQDVLVKLMYDLYELADSGITDEQCKHIRDALEKISISMSNIPDNFLFTGSIMSAFDKFKDLYIDWNDVKGQDDRAIKKRTYILEKMKNKRHKLASITRKNQHILYKNLDLKLIEDMYQALGSIPNAFPELFKNLGSAIQRYFDKDSGITISTD